MTSNSSGAPPAGAGPGTGGSKRLAQQQAQVDEVVDIMRQNVDKVLERDKNLSLLDDRADKLQHNAAQFEQHAGKLKRKFWWKNMKMMIVMGIVGTIFAIVVIAWIASKVKTVAPINPAASDAATTPIASMKDEVVPVAGGSMGIPSEDRPTTKRRKKTTTAKVSATTVVNAAGAAVNVPANDDDAAGGGTGGSSTGDDASKAAIKRTIRAILSRL